MEQVEFIESLKMLTNQVNLISDCARARSEVSLFPSGLQHFVEPNQSVTPRHSIAFNTFLKGQLGDNRDVSELTLA